MVRGRKRSGVRYFGPYPTWGPSGAPSTCCCARFRSGRARTPSSATTSAWAGPACCSTSSGARGPAWGRSTQEVYDGLVADLATFLAGDTGPLERELETAMQEASGALDFERAGDAARQARGRPHGRCRPADGTRPARGPRRGRPGRGRARGRGADLPCAAGRVVGRSGPVRRQGGGPRPRRAGGPAAGRRLRRCRVRGAPADPRAHHALRPRGGQRLPGRAAGRNGGRQGAPAGTEGRPARDRPAQRRRRLRAPPPTAHLRPQQPGPGPRGPPA